MFKMTIPLTFVCDYYQKKLHHYITITSNHDTDFGSFYLNYFYIDSRQNTQFYIPDHLSYLVSEDWNWLPLCVSNSLLWRFTDPRISSPFSCYLLENVHVSRPSKCSFFVVPFVPFTLMFFSPGLGGTNETFIVFQCLTIGRDLYQPSTSTSNFFPPKNYIIHPLQFILMVFFFFFRFII